MGAIGPLVLLIVAIVVISAVVGAIAQFMNKLNEANAPSPRRLDVREPSRQPDKEMDRFLAEIDRLRKKNAEPAEPTAAKPQGGAKPNLKPKPAVRVNSRSEKPKGRIVAELVEPLPKRRGNVAPIALPVPPPDGSTKSEILPIATVLGLATLGEVSATKLPQRGRPDPKTNFAKNLTNLLNSGQGAAMAVILQEILGPPKSKKS